MHHRSQFTASRFSNSAPDEVTTTYPTHSARRYTETKSSEISTDMFTRNSSSTSSDSDSHEFVESDVISTPTYATSAPTVDVESPVRRSGAHRLPTPPSALKGRAAVLAVAAGAVVAAGQAVVNDGSSSAADHSEVALANESSAIGTTAEPQAAQFAPATSTAATTEADAPQVLNVAAPTDLSQFSNLLAKGQRFSDERAAREAAARRPLFVLPAVGTFTSNFGTRWGAPCTPASTSPPPRSGRPSSPSPTARSSIQVRLPGSACGYAYSTQTERSPSTATSTRPPSRLVSRSWPATRSPLSATAASPPARTFTSRFISPARTRSIPSPGSPHAASASASSRTDRKPNASDEKLPARTFPGTGPEVFACLLQLDHRHTADEHQPHLARATEVDGDRRGGGASALGFQHGAQTVLVVTDAVTRGEDQNVVAATRGTETGSRRGLAGPSPVVLPAAVSLAALAAVAASAAVTRPAASESATGARILTAPVDQVLRDLLDEPRRRVLDRLPPHAERMIARVRYRRCLARVMPT